MIASDGDSALDGDPSNPFLKLPASELSHKKKLSWLAFVGMFALLTVVGLAGFQLRSGNALPPSTEAPTDVSDPHFDSPNFPTKRFDEKHAASVAPPPFPVEQEFSFEYSPLAYVPDVATTAVPDNAPPIKPSRTAELMVQRLQLGMSPDEVKAQIGEPIQIVPVTYEETDGSPRYADIWNYSDGLRINFENSTVVGIHIDQ